MRIVRITPPSEAIVSLTELKLHLRVDGDDEDGTILALLSAATAWLDGYRGVLGRCVMPQQWAVTYEQAGTYRLPLPDVSSVSASVGTAELDDCMVTISEPCTVVMTAASPEDIVDSCQQIVKLLVGHWFLNREAVSASGMSEVPLSVDALLAPIRWVQ